MIEWTDEEPLSVALLWGCSGWWLLRLPLRCAKSSDQFFATTPIVAAMFNSVGANCRMISSNSLLRVRSAWVSPSRRDKTLRNSRF